MSTVTGEKDKNDWPTVTNLYPAEAQAFQPLAELAGGDITTQGYTHIGNNYRDNYKQTGSHDSHSWALYCYDNALATVGNDRLLEAWVVCSRLDLYLYDLQANRISLEDVREELALAEEAAEKAITFRPVRREFRARTLEWLKQTATSLEPPALAAEATHQYRFPRLKLIGGTAVSGEVEPAPVPGPGAA